MLRSRTSVPFGTHTNANRPPHTNVPRSGGTPRYAHWGEGNENDTVTCAGPVVNRKKICWGSSVIGFVYNLCSNNKASKCKKVLLELVHALLGVSHSWRASEIASFLSRWCWSGPSSLTSHSGVARLWGLCRVQQANCGGPGSFIFYPCNPPLTQKAEKETLLFCRQTARWKLSCFFFFWCKTWCYVISIYK